jgi:hypothetical protein
MSSLEHLPGSGKAFWVASDVGDYATPLQHMRKELEDQRSRYQVVAAILHEHVAIRQRDLHVLCVRDERHSAFSQRACT